MRNPKKKVPTSVTVIAVLHLIFGGLGLCSSLGGLVMGQMQMQTAANDPGAKLQKDLEAEMTDKIPGYKVVQIGEAVVSIALCLTLIACGIGLFQLQPWARIGSIVYAVASILFGIAAAVYAFIYVVPVVKEAFGRLAQANPNMPKEALQFVEMGLTAAPFLSLCGMIYPVVVLIIMMTGTVQKAFSGQGGYDSGKPDDGYDDYPPQKPYDDYPPQYPPPGDGGYPPGGYQPPR